MKRTLLAVCAVAAPLALMAAEPLRTPAEIVSRWPARPAAAARAMIGKYGPPARFGEHALLWDAAGPWKKIVVYSNAWPMFTGTPDKGYLEQTIDRQVPARMVSALTRFDRRLRIDEETAELSSRSETEAENFLALNLAEEIISGARTPGEAREFRDRTLELARAGKSSPYLAGFVFTRL
jgi:hypothetical protein